MTIPLLEALLRCPHGLGPGFGSGSQAAPAAPGQVLSAVVTTELTRLVSALCAGSCGTVVCMYPLIDSPSSPEMCALINISVFQMQSSGVSHSHPQLWELVG